MAGPAFTDKTTAARYAHSLGLAARVDRDSDQNARRLLTEQPRWMRTA